jgi:hypothetical protein
MNKTEKGRLVFRFFNIFHSVYYDTIVKCKPTSGTHIVKITVMI